MTSRFCILYKGNVIWVLLLTEGWKNMSYFQIMVTHDYLLAIGCICIKLPIIFCECLKKHSNFREIDLKNQILLWKFIILDGYFCTVYKNVHWKILIVLRENVTFFTNIRRKIVLDYVNCEKKSTKFDCFHTRRNL